jgi:long-chain acyl-CoA synthetase
VSRTLVDLLDDSFARYGQRTAVRTLRKAGAEAEMRYEPISYAELAHQRDAVAAGFAKLGLVKGDRVGILTDGGLEPLLVFLATDKCGMCAVPLCTKFPAELLIHAINHSSLALLVLDRTGYEQYLRIDELLENAPQLALTGAGQDGQLTWSQLTKSGEESQPPEVEVYPDDDSKILYTSGSSGLPKGVIQTHANIVANLHEVWNVISPREVLRFFKSAPDYHAMGILNVYYPLAKGWELDMARSPDRVLSDIRFSEPQGLLTVPLVLDKVYGNVRKAIDAGRLKGSLIARAVGGKQRLARRQGSVVDLMFHRLIGSKVIGKIKRQLASKVGGNLELLVVGSAKADPEALDFFQEVLDITAFEGYGVTECAPLVAANHMGGRKTGTVGRPLIAVKLVDASGAIIGSGDPENGEYHGSRDGVGELWASGANVMKGYLNDPEQTALVLVEDEEGRVWYRTGDLFSMDDQGFLSFHGRLGRQFKLKNGEFINPELLERIFSRVPLIEHVLIFGDQSRTYPMPVVSVDVDEVRRQIGEGAFPELEQEPDEAVRRDEGLAHRIRELIVREARQAGLPAYARPQKVLLLPEPLHEDNGTLTKGLKKIVPGAVAEQYRTLIQAAYE